MCENVNEIIFCSCESGFRGFMWKIKKIIHNDEPFIFKIGDILFPKDVLIDKLVDIDIKKLLDKIAFDFDYKPDKGDVFEVMHTDKLEYNVFEYNGEEWLFSTKHAGFNDDEILLEKGCVKIGGVE